MILLDLTSDDVKLILQRLHESNNHYRQLIRDNKYGWKELNKNMKLAHKITASLPKEQPKP